VREGEGIAVNVLRGLGINLDRVRTQTARNLLQNQAQSKEKQKKEAAESVHSERAVYKERLAETISERN